MMENRFLGLDGASASWAFAPLGEPCQWCPGLGVMPSAIRQSKGWVYAFFLHTTRLEKLPSDLTCNRIFKAASRWDLAQKKAEPVFSVPLVQVFRKFCTSLLKQLEDHPGLYCSEMSFKSECLRLSIACPVMALSLPTASAGNGPVLPASFPGRRISYILAWWFGSSCVPERPSVLE